MRWTLSPSAPLVPALTRSAPPPTACSYHGKIQDHAADYYMQFNLIVTGLDSIEARRWINATLVGMVDADNPESLKPLIDGGTEGFKGQARVILPTITSCYECSVSAGPRPRRSRGGSARADHVRRGSDRHAHPADGLPDMHDRQHAAPPRALHRVGQRARVAKAVQGWVPGLRPRPIRRHRRALTAAALDTKLDNDDPEHIEWLYQHALARANEFSIQGVTWSLTQGVVKNIIPAIASTNAIIAGGSRVLGRSPGRRGRAAH